MHKHLQLTTDQVVPKQLATTNQAQFGSLPSVCVVGAGTMGAAMVRRLLDSGIEVAVWSRHPESAGDLVEAGATSFADVADAVSGADIVITMLPTASVTRAVMFEGAALEGMRTGAIWVQMGTIGVPETEQFEVDALSVRPDVTLVDAPVSGSRVPAQNGQLLILASGPTSAQPKVQPVFAALGRATLWLGPVGAGSRMKLVLNTWLAFQTEAAAEAAALAEDFGLSNEDLVTALRGNPLASPYALTKLDRMLDSDYHTDFSLGWALKDLDLVAEEGPGSAPVAAAIARRWRRLVQEGWGDADVSAARNGLGLDATVETTRSRKEMVK